MTMHSRILAGAALVALVTSAGAAQGPTRLRAANFGPAAAAAPDSAHIAAALAAARVLVENGRLREAMRSFHTVAVEQREAGDYPAEALRRLANLQYGADQRLDAATTLDELAEAALQFGDPATRLRALFDAAVIYQELKIKDRVPARVRQIDQLLKSPVIDEALRSEIASRINRG
ncbi:MAG: tol-pal system YbgF family protein [Gemmatimonadales bacterium]